VQHRPELPPVAGLPLRAVAYGIDARYRHAGWVERYLGQWDRYHGWRFHRFSHRFPGTRERKSGLGKLNIAGSLGGSEVRKEFLLEAGQRIL